jgi:hypothetical protein
MPVRAKTRRTAALAGMTSRSSPPSARARLCPHQDAQPGRIAELGAGYVHDEGGVPAGRGFEENRLQPAGVAGVDFLGRHHHGHALDHLDGVPDTRHLCPVPCQNSRTGSELLFL